MIRRKLTTRAACRVARIDRDRFNEHVAAGRFGCAPDTIPGRSRLFDPDDVLALWLFRELMEDGFEATVAGRIACKVAECSRQYPEARAISYLQDYFKPVGGFALPADEVPEHGHWDSVTIGGADIRKVTTFRIGKLRELIAHYTEEEFNVAGEDD
jgi:hypothetical protein